MKRLLSVQHTRFFRMCMAHPYALVFGCGLFALGCATGVSTCAFLAQRDMLTACAEAIAAAGSTLGRGLLRAGLFQCTLCFCMMSALFRRSFTPLACAALVLKGLAVGLAVGQLHLEYGWLGLLYALLCVALPSFCTVTGLLLCFGHALAGTAKKQGKAEPPRDAEAGRRLVLLKTLFLTGMGVLLEALAAQALLAKLIA